MALTTLIVTFTVCLGRTRLSLTPTARLLLLGIAVLALPLLYTRAEWREDALWRCAGLLGGWLFYVACLQLRLTPRQRELLLYGLLFAVGVQALLAALQLFAPILAWVAPNGSRVYGVFQQPNVLGSFIATGLALALWLLLAPLSAPTWRRQLPLLALLVAFSALLVLIQSRRRRCCCGALPASARPQAAGPAARCCWAWRSAPRCCSPVSAWMAARV
ncbi:pilin glycosylation ligase domain-containing protein [Serratia marcescens]|uniref:pilin glycosylation ligase domain-containing protein n=1 Tax=Serratia marcescens TaxID=615 RepID=UPI00217EC411|nr:pilin glycosylation ligase domain-containing protein [Serratia marcescens]